MILLDMTDFPCFESPLSTVYASRLARLLIYRTDLGPSGPLVICAPAFEPEWAVRFRVEFNGEVKVFSMEAAENIFMALQDGKSCKDAKVNVSKKEFDRGCYAEICTVFEKMLTRTSEEPHRTGTDGVTYYFGLYREKGRLLNGRTWCPEAGTFPALARELADRLKTFAKCQPAEESSAISQIRESLEKMKGELHAEK